jgi:hypothetical protein
MIRDVAIPLMRANPGSVFPPCRIVNVASEWAGDLDLNDPEFKKNQYSKSFNRRYELNITITN